jgi:alkylation response protein AidB-like acyl-CoA dehydrogenase
MDIQFREEQELLRSSVQRLLRDQYDFEARRKIVATEEGFSRRHWASFADLGLFAAPFAEDVGGLGGGPLSTMIVMQEFGRHLVVEPFFETVVLAGGLVADAGSADQQAAHLSKIISGDEVWSLAWAEGRSRYDLANVTTTARRDGDHYVLSGTKAAVVAAPWADKLIVSARTFGNQRDRDGVSLFVIDRHAPNLHLQSFRTIDGRRAAEVALMNVPCRQTLLGKEGRVLPRWRPVAIAPSPRLRRGRRRNARRNGDAGLLENAKTVRRDARHLPRAARNMVGSVHHASRAILMQPSTDPCRERGRASRLASGAKSKIGYAAKFVADQAVQLHGGMGMSDELNVGHYFKRISAINIQFGDPAYHMLRYAQIDAAA